MIINIIHKIILIMNFFEQNNKIFENNLRFNFNRIHLVFQYNLF